MKGVLPLAGLLLVATVSMTTAQLPESVCSSPLTVGNTWVRSSSSAGNMKPSDVLTEAGWCADVSQQGPHWLEIEFPVAHGFRAFSIGRHAARPDSYATNVTLQWLMTGQNQLMDYITQTGVLTAELNSTLSKSTVRLTGVVTTRIRFIINSWTKEPCMNLTVLGCANPEVLCPLGCKNGGHCSYEMTCACPGSFSGADCSISACESRELGLADGRIPSDQITSSTEDNVYKLVNVRLNCCQDGSSGGWCPAEGDASPWLRVKLQKPMSVDGLHFRFMQHPGTKKQFMETFELQYTVPADSAHIYRTFQTDIPGLNATHEFIIKLVPSIVTDTIRIVPKSSLGRPCFRLELLGCSPDKLCADNWCQNGGTCVGENVCQCPKGFYGVKCAERTIPTTDLAFTEIKNNMVLTPTFSFHISGTVTLQIINTTTVLSLTGPNSNIKLDPTTLTTAGCLGNIDKCTSGFTFSVELNFKDLKDNTYLISSGGNLPDSTGLALYYSQHQLIYIVSTTTGIWTVVAPYTPVINTWQHFEITWSHTLGVGLLLDGHVLATSGRPNPRPTAPTTTHEICVGCSHTTATVVINMLVQNFHAWSLERTELVNAEVVNVPSQSTTTNSPATDKTTTTPKQTTASTTDPVTVPPTRPQRIRCMTCGGNDCVHYYGPGTCNSPNSYCISKLTNRPDGSRSVERRCGSFDECNRDWLNDSANSKRCVGYQMHLQSFLALNCTYCCTKDLCNDNIVPSSDSLFHG